MDKWGEIRVTPEFKKKLDREIRLFIRETQDGCVDCQEEIKKTGKYGCCNKHGKLFLDLAINPRKFIKIKNSEKKT